MPNERGELELYLVEAECIDGIERWLDLTIRRSPTLKESNVIRVYSSSVRRERILTVDEIRHLATIMDDGRLKQSLFSLFGIDSLESLPGLPSGPYYYVDSDVLESVRAHV